MHALSAVTARNRMKPPQVPDTATKAAAQPAMQSDREWPQRKQVIGHNSKIALDWYGVYKRHDCVVQIAMASRPLLHWPGIILLHATRFIQARASAGHF